MLQIKNLHASIEGKEILKGINLTVNAGEVHAIMGPNGSGKSTLSSVLAGRDIYEITEGSVTFNDKNLLELEPDERAHEGIFLAFQYPVEIPGVNTANFLRTALNEKRKAAGQDPVSGADFLKTLKEKMQLLEIDQSFTGRSLNEGFSGGEKKRNEMLQMAILNPKLGILDETDSGLDIDALKVVSNAVNKIRSKENAFVVITHYQRLLNYIVPDFVHVLQNGKIVKSGGKELALELETSGYEEFRASN